MTITATSIADEEPAGSPRRRVVTFVASKSRCRSPPNAGPRLRTARRSDAPVIVTTLCSPMSTPLRAMPLTSVAPFMWSYIVDANTSISSPSMASSGPYSVARSSPLNRSSGQRQLVAM